MLTALVFAIGSASYTDIVFAQSGGFDFEKDLLLVQYDFKTDVDDLHSVAAFTTLISDSRYAGINYHAVAGTYGIQDGLYVPPNKLMNLAFNDNWSDAHQDWNKAIDRVAGLVQQTIDDQGDVWIADGGQSDFSADVLRRLRELDSEVDTEERIHIIQHSNWNEEVTASEDLRYAKEYADYQKIPDGNALHNGTPGFRSSEVFDLSKHVSSADVLMVWETAIEIANKYNGMDGRYLNESIKSGGLDFSDFSEVCWILGLLDIEDSREFFKYF